MAFVLLIHINFNRSVLKRTSRLSIHFKLLCSAGVTYHLRKWKYYVQYCTKKQLPCRTCLNNCWRSGTPAQPGYGKGREIYVGRIGIFLLHVPGTNVIHKLTPTKVKLLEHIYGIIYIILRQSKIRYLHTPAIINPPLFRSWHLMFYRHPVHIIISSLVRCLSIDNIINTAIILVQAPPTLLIWLVRRITRSVVFKTNKVCWKLRSGKLWWL